MSKWFLLLATLFCSLGFAAPIRDHRLDPKALSSLAAALDISPDADLIEATQERWLRKPGLERWEIAELSPEKRLFVLHWAEEQGFFAPWMPSEPLYDQALILGATTSRMQSRLAYLVHLWNEGTRFSEIVWLTGERLLDPRVDSLTDRAETESDAARILWNEAYLPEEMRQLPVLFVDASVKEGQKRPNTADTIHAWLEKEPKPGKPLFISDQPFCGYQFAVIKALLPDAYAFDVAGEGVCSTNHPAAGAIILDSVARWIYQEGKACSRSNTQ